MKAKIICLFGKEAIYLFALIAICMSPVSCATGSAPIQEVETTSFAKTQDCEPKYELIYQPPNRAGGPGKLIRIANKDQCSHSEVSGNPISVSEDYVPSRFDVEALLNNDDVLSTASNEDQILDVLTASISPVADFQSFQLQVDADLEARTKACDYQLQTRDWTGLEDIIVEACMVYRADDSEINFRQFYTVRLAIFQCHRIGCGESIDALLKKFWSYERFQELNVLEQTEYADASANNPTICLTRDKECVVFEGFFMRRYFLPSVFTIFSTQSLAADVMMGRTSDTEVFCKRKNLFQTSALSLSGDEGEVLDLAMKDVVDEIFLATCMP